jgi:hypothetical protein
MKDDDIVSHVEYHSYLLVVHDLFTGYHVGDFTHVAWVPNRTSKLGPPTPCDEIHHSFVERLRYGRDRNTVGICAYARVAGLFTRSSYSDVFNKNWIKRTEELLCDYNPPRWTEANWDDLLDVRDYDLRVTYLTSSIVPL